MKCVTRTGGVHAVHRKRRRSNFAALEPGEASLFAERDRDKRRGVIRGDCRNRPAWLGITCKRGWELLRGKNDVDLAEEIADPFTHLLHVNHRGNPGRARMAGRLRGRRGFMAVDQQHTTTGDCVGRDLFRRDGQTRMAVPQDCSFTRGFIHDHDRELTRGAAHVPRGADIDAFIGQAPAAGDGKIVIAEAADIAGPPPQSRADRGGGGHLPPGELRELTQLLLGIARRVLCNERHEVDAVEAKGDDVKALSRTRAWLNG